MRILHILDHSLPMHSGYTFRTRAILKAQQELGWDVRGVTGLRHTADGPKVEEIDGLIFHRTPGAAVPLPVLREWSEVAAFAERIDALVEQYRPDVLHAHSTVLNALAGLRVARKRWLPFVYEIRAFWEDAAVGNGTVK
jgi:glycogen(starch) synthase